MTDARFFPNVGPFSLRKLQEITECEVAIANGDGTHSAVDHATLEQQIVDVAPLDRASSEHLSFLDNAKYIEVFRQSRAGFCLLRPKQAEAAPKGMVLLLTADPYRCYALIAQAFYPRKLSDGQISPHAVIHPTATIGENAHIDPGAVIGAQAVIGKDCIIGANTVIGDAVQIGDSVQIGANSTLSHCLIGHRVIIHRGVHIGQDGFGFALGRGGHVKVPQLGRVVIEDDVEIGSGTCIDRGTGPDTLIGSGTKIDNLVQIGHNVQIGKHAVIVAQVGIAGSTRIGDGAVLAGQVGVAGHLKIGAGARIAAQSGLMTDVPTGASYGGSPAIPVSEWHRQSVVLARLAKRKGESAS
jgi:UDP-3-O-[3-hydroxymyristoyl] glucosamine N-acyltransferase